MTILYLRILFFCLIPIGVFILIKGIKLLRKSFNGKVIMEIPFAQKREQFSISKSGNYSIWQKGELLKVTPVHEFRPHIYNELTNEEINLNFSILNPRSHDFSNGRMEIFTFYATEGNYRIELKKGKSVFGLQRLLPIKSADTSKYYIQIRESQAQIFAFMAIPICILGAFGIIGGFVLGLLADQII